MFLKKSKNFHKKKFFDPLLQYKLLSKLQQKQYEKTYSSWNCVKRRIVRETWYI